MNKLVLLFLPLILLLVGCEHTQEIPDTRIVYKNVLITPPDNLIQDCEKQAPPDIEEYLNANWTRKEELLIESFEKAIEKTTICNIRFEGLRTWKDKQIQVFDKIDESVK